MGVFVEQTRELVQWMEDNLHGITWTEARRKKTAVSDRVKALMVEVARHYNVSDDIVVSVGPRAIDSVLVTTVSANDETFAAIKDNEPELWNVITSDQRGECTCQAIDGVTHSHGD